MINLNASEFILHYFQRMDHLICLFNWKIPPWLPLFQNFCSLYPFDNSLHLFITYAFDSVYGINLNNIAILLIVHLYMNVILKYSYFACIIYFCSNMIIWCMLVKCNQKSDHKSPTCLAIFFMTYLKLFIL